MNRSYYTILLILLVSKLIFSQNLDLQVRSPLQCSNVTITPDGEKLIFESPEHDVFICDMESGEVTNILHEFRDVHSLKVNEERELIVLGQTKDYYHGCSIKIWHLDNLDSLKVIDSNKSTVGAKYYQKNNLLIRLESNDLELRYLSDLNKKPFIIGNSYSMVRTFEIDEKRDLLAVGWDNGYIEIWNLKEMKLIANFQHQNTDINDLIFHPQKEVIAYIDQYIVKQYNWLENKFETQINDPYRVNKLHEYSNDGEFLTLMNSNGISIYSTFTGYPRKRLQKRSYDFTIRDNLLFAADNRGIELWNYKTESLELIMSFFGRGRCVIYKTTDNFFDCNDDGLQYLVCNKDKNSYQASYSDNFYVDNLYQKVISSEIDSIRARLGKVKIDKSLVPINRAGKDRALIFANDKYPILGNLNNPVSDAYAVKDILEKYYNFEVDLRVNLERDSILKVLNEKKDIAFDDKDQLFILFTGHGVAEAFAAKNSKQEEEDFNKDSYVKYYDVQNLLNEYGCKHILVGIDACFSGTFATSNPLKGRQKTNKRPEEKSDREKFANRILKDSSYIFLASGGDEPTSDGKKHSPYIRQFLIALESKGGEDEILDMSELYNYMLKAVPIPRKGRFDECNSDNGFLFIVN